MTPGRRWASRRAALRSPSVRSDALRARRGRSVRDRRPAPDSLERLPAFLGDDLDPGVSGGAARSRHVVTIAGCWSGRRGVTKKAEEPGVSGGARGVRGVGDRNGLRDGDRRGAHRHAEAGNDEDRGESPSRDRGTADPDAALPDSTEVVGTTSLGAPALIVLGHLSGPPAELAACDDQGRGTAPTP